MPRRTDIHSILIIGSGPIVIGQGCEFDYSGVQACRALKEEGYRVVLINSNPATIMTDPEFADATYIEPITPEAVEKILAHEKAAGHPVDAVLPTLGGQTGLNTAMSCYDTGIFTKYGVEMIGAKREAIFRGEDRQVFKDLMIKIGLKVPKSGVVHSLDEGRKVLEDLGLPLIIRPAFTLGGTGGGIAYNIEEFETIVQRGIDASPVSEVLIEQSVIGWKEFEMEVMRDKNDNAVIICSIENIDAMGVHTGDSITVAPIQTLTDKEYQRMRDASIAIIRAVGVETGGSNIQFAINPDNGEMIVVEMNPRVSRSSALASKATGYPIAKLAAKLAVGYTLDELPNYIASKRSKDGKAWDTHTSACFEPSIDYVVIKIPRWTFEKFPDADETLTTQMKSVGEAMAIGRTFKEALQKGIRSMEVKRFGFGLDKYDKWLNAQHSANDGSGTGGPPVSSVSSEKKDHGRAAHATRDDSDKTTQGESIDHEWPIPEGKLRRKLAVPSQGRLYYIRYAMKMGWTIEKIHELTNIDPWFLAQMKQLVDFEDELREGRKYYFDESAPEYKTRGMIDGILMQAKQWGYSDIQLASIWSVTPSHVRELRKMGSIEPVYKLVDTCAAEFEAATPYYYSTYETRFHTVSPKDGSFESWQPSGEDEIRLTDRPKVIIIGGGPNRIGQGIEFDYCCVQAAFAMRELGLESVMINSNPETVSTDYDTSDLLFFEPLTHEDVLNVCERLNGGTFTSGSLSPVLRGEGEGEGPSAQLRGSPLTPALSPEYRGEGANAPRRNLVKGVIVQFGGQTPLNLARGLKDAGVPILGTTVESLDAAGDREQFRALVQQLNLKQPENGIARSVAEAREIAKRIGYPVLVRPSFVLGGRAMEIVSDENQLNYYMANAVDASTIADAPILVDKFLDAATEVDVDCLADYDPHVGESDGAGPYRPGRTEGPSSASPERGSAPTGAQADGAGPYRPGWTEGPSSASPERGFAPTGAQADGAGPCRPGRTAGPSSASPERGFAPTGAQADGAGPYRPGRTEGPSSASPERGSAPTGAQADGAGPCRPGRTAGPSSTSPERGFAPTGATRPGSEVDPATQHAALSTQHSQAIIIGVMEHIEEAGIHSGDSACSLPPYSLSKEIVERLKTQTRALAKALRVRGLMNVQYAIKDNEIYLIEVNPRASRTVPFVSKATGVSWAKIAAKVMAGKSLAELGAKELPDTKHVSVKEVVFPFAKFPGVDVILGPEMRSTGEVMGIDSDFPMAYAKAQLASGSVLPTKGAVFISVRDGDKEAVVPAARMLADAGFQLIATGGTHDVLLRNDVPALRISKLAEGRPNIRDLIKNGKVQLIINTPTKKGPQTDEGKIRALALMNKVPIVTTITGAHAVAKAMIAMQKQDWGVRPLQEYFTSPAPAIAP